MSAPDPAALPYRRGVGIVLINLDGLVWVGERHDMPGAWQMPQGGIDDGEAPRDTALRELAEETGAHGVEILAESADWYSYDLPPELLGLVWGGRYRGQTQKWFVCRFMGEDSEFDLDVAGDGEFSRWRWVTAEALPGLIVPFKRRLYESILSEFHSVIGAPSGK